MKRVLHIARREWLEQLRQPGMLAVITTLYVLVAGSGVLAVAMLQLIDTVGDSAGLAMMMGMPPGEAAELAGEATLTAMVGGMVTYYNFIVYTQFLGIASVLSGHAILHDRQCGTLTFLLLAPVGRAELIAGKVLGSIGPSFALYVAVYGAGSLLLTAFPVTGPHAAQLPSSPAWWIAFLAGGPLLATFTATVCTAVSAVARDVRGAQQAVWFIVFFAVLGCGPLVTSALPAGVAVQVAVAIGGALATGMALFVGASVLARDLGR